MTLKELYSVIDGEVRQLISEIDALYKKVSEGVLLYEQGDQ